MDPIALTRALVDIESITGNEAPVGEFLEGALTTLGYEGGRMPGERHRFNVIAVPPNLPAPEVFFSTHLDTVPPFIPSSEDERNIYGRGSAMPKELLPHRSPQQRNCGTRALPPGSYF